MAKIRPILGELRGRIAGVVFSHNKGGDYVRKGTTPTNPNTARQQATRTILGDLASAWTNTLSAAQRDAWNTYAEGHSIKDAFGEDIYITGLAWFQRCNARLIDAGDAIMTSPPAGVAPGGITQLTVAFSGGDQVDVDITGALGADERLQLFGSLPVSQGSNPNFRQCRLFGYSALGAGGSTINFTTPYTFAIGNRVVCYAAIVNAEGLIGPYQRAAANRAA